MIFMQNKAKIIIPLVVLVIIIVAIGTIINSSIFVQWEPVAIQNSNNSVKLKVYIENSGSMDGYMCDGSQLKDAVFDYVSDLSVCSDTTSLNYINNRIIPYKGSLEQYIKTMSPTTFQKAGGNHSNSDLGEMLSMILQEMTDTSVSIFISDCILDLPVSNSQKFLSRCQISIKNAINEFLLLCSVGLCLSTISSYFLLIIFNSL